MNFSKKSFLILSIFLIFSVFISGYKPHTLQNSLDNSIKNTDIAKNSIISVSVRDANTEQIIYQKDADKLLHPASVLKSLTTPVMMDVLGKNYKISTAIYIAGKQNFYLKLSGDPLLQTDDLSKLALSLKSKGYSQIRGYIYIDDTVIDDIPWGIGWMWDDENNPYMPKYNAYNINRNLITVKITPGQQKQKPVVEISPFYSVKIINNALTSNQNNSVIERKVWKDTEAIYIDGIISQITEKTLPVGKPENFFKYLFLKAFNDCGIKFSGRYTTAKLPENAVLICEISHNLLDEIKNINQNSDNLAAETIFKIAGAKFSGSIGSTESGMIAFNDFYSKLGLDMTDISIADASGVSQNNLIYSNWITLAMSKLYKTADFEEYKATLASPTLSGTLQNRLGFLSGKLYAKTGTNFGVSSIAGFITVKSGKTYTFAIMIQNFSGSSEDAKLLEDKILKIISEI